MLKNPKNELYDCAVLIGMTKASVDNMVSFCNRNKITRLYNPIVFMNRWKNNPITAKVEALNYVKEKERLLDKEKMQKQVANHALIEMCKLRFGEIDIASIGKVAEMPKRPAQRPLPKTEYKPKSCNQIEKGL